MKEKEKALKPRFNTSDFTLGWEGNEEGTDWADEIAAEDVSVYSQAAHKRDIKGYDLSQNALCFEVLGAISLIVGILFIFLSLKKERNKITGVNFASLQFVICVLCLSLGVVLLAIGTTNLVRSILLRNAAKKDINYLATLSRK